MYVIPNTKETLGDSRGELGKTEGNKEDYKHLALKQNLDPSYVLLLGTRSYISGSDVASTQGYLTNQAACSPLV